MDGPYAAMWSPSVSGIAAAESRPALSVRRLSFSLGLSPRSEQPPPQLQPAATSGLTATGARSSLRVYAPSGVPRPPPSPEDVNAAPIAPLDLSAARRASAAAAAASATPVRASGPPSKGEVTAAAAGVALYQALSPQRSLSPAGSSASTSGPLCYICLRRILPPRPAPTCRGTTTASCAGSGCTGRAGGWSWCPCPSTHQAPRPRPLPRVPRAMRRRCCSSTEAALSVV
jgi:hypothetical protein